MEVGGWIWLSQFQDRTVDDFVKGLSGGLGKYENTPTGKAIRACLMEISDYLGCVMVDKDDCVAEYKAKESSRRDKTKKSIKLD